MSERTVDDVLAELGAALRVAAERPPRRRRGRTRTLVLLVVAVLAAGSSAVATRSVWAPPMPGDRSPGGMVVQLAAGGPPAARWMLSARRCTDGTAAAYVRVGAGGGGRGCAGRPTVIDGYYDPQGGRSYAFALLPASAESVRVGLRGQPAPGAAPGVADVRVRPIDVDGEALRRAGLPPLRAVIVSRAGIWTPATLAAFDGHGRSVRACQEPRCGG